MGAFFIDSDGTTRLTWDDAVAGRRQANPVQDLVDSAEQTVRAMQAARDRLPPESSEDIDNAQREFARFLADNGLDGELTRVLGMDGQPFIDVDGKAQIAGFSRTWWEVKIVTGRGALKAQVASAAAWPQGVRGMGLADLLALREAERQRTLALFGQKVGKTRLRTPKPAGLP